MLDENISNLKKPVLPQRDYDLVFCIDISNSMASLLEDVKKMALRLPDDIL